MIDACCLRQIVIRTGFLIPTCTYVVRMSHRAFQYRICQADPDRPMYLNMTQRGRLKGDRRGCFRRDNSPPLLTQADYLIEILHHASLVSIQCTKRYVD
jgi:hypothetical protein